MGASTSKIQPEDTNTNKFSHFAQSDLTRWSSSFKSTFLSNLITRPDLEKILKCFFPFGDPKNFLTLLFDTINISGSDKIDIHEFLIALAILSKGSRFEKLRWIFRFYDVDNDGVISKHELKYCAKAVYDMCGATLGLNEDSDVLVEKLFIELENESGFLTFDDFKQISKNNSKEFDFLNLKF